MKPTRTTRLLLITSLALTVTQVHADEILQRLETAKQAYQAGELKRTLDTLNEAVSKVQEQITGELLKLFPSPLEGWQAEPAQAQSGGLASMITGTHLSRRYTNADGAEITLTLMADSPMMPMLTMAISMPFLMQSSDEMKTYSLKGERGMLEHTPGSRAYKATVLVGNRLLIQGEGSGLDDQASLDAYLLALDIEAIQAALNQ